MEDGVPIGKGNVRGRGRSGQPLSNVLRLFAGEPTVEALVTRRRHRCG